MLSRDVYANGRQFENLDEHKEAIMYAWERLDIEDLKKLVKGMPRRIIKLLEKEGCATSYA